MWNRPRALAKKAQPVQARLMMESLEDRTVPAAFTPGNLVIYQVGDGGGSLVNTGSPVYLSEYTPTGTLVQTLALPRTASGGNNPLVADGTATSEGFLTLSSDGHYLLLTGYASTLPGSAALSGSSVPRVVGRVDADANIDTSTALTDFASGRSPRGVASTNGTDLWITGAAGGVRYTTLGSTTSTQLSTTVTAIRNVAIFGDQLYISDNSGSTVRLGTVGTGLPTTSGQTITNLPGFPTSGSPYGFFLADLDTGVAGVDTLYVASDDAAALTKYSLVDGSWVSKGTVGSNSDAYRGLTGIVEGGTVTLYATRKAFSGSTGGGELVKITDSTGYDGTFSGTPTVLATAGVNIAFRGVAFVPVAAIPNNAPVLSGANNFTAINEDDTANGGTLVSDLISGQASDANSGDPQGIAVTTVSTANGSWEFTTNGGTNWTGVGTVSATSALLLKADADTKLRFVPNTNFHGTDSSAVTFRAWDQTSGTAGDKADVSTNGGSTAFSADTAAATITVNPVADTPSVTHETTNEDEPTPIGIVISRNTADGDEVTHIKITNITNGTLFQSDGTTEVKDGEFITVAQGSGGLKFTPAANFFGTGSFDVRAATGNLDQFLGGVTVTATILVSPIADSPSVTNATTAANTQTTSGLVISPNPVDGTSVGHFRITNITNGTLFLNDGITPVSEGDLVSVEEAGKGLKFSPAVNFVGTGSFDIQASIPDIGVGGEFVTATITVTSLFTPTATDATTDEDTQTTSGLVITANPADGGATAFYQITNIVGGTLFANGTPVAAGEFIAATTGSALTFLPDADLNGATTSFFGFDVQAATAAAAGALTGGVVTATVTVNVVNDEPTFDLGTNVVVDEDSGDFVGTGFATNIVPGPATATDEVDQVLTFSTNNDNSALFSVQPSIGADGNLTFTPAPDAFGTATVTVTLTDDGSGIAPNDNSFTRTFTITVNPVADTPSVTTATTDEDTQTTGGLVISRNPADGSEVTHFHITGITNGALFLSDGATEISDGDFITFAQGNAGLKFTPALDLNDLTATFGFDVRASLDGISVIGGAATATVTVTPVNDAPAVTLKPSVSVNQDSGPFSQSEFAAFAPGGGSDEQTQTATYTLTATNPALFSNPPAISASGVLTFTPAPGASGTAVVTVTVQDSGPGTAPDDNTGVPRQLTITIIPAPVVIDPPAPEFPGSPDAGAQFIAIGTDAGTLGRVRILSAATGAVVRELIPFPGFLGGVRVAVGDVTGDGIDDTVAGTAIGGAHVKVFDGITGAEVRSFLAFDGFVGGVTLAAGDLDRDGRADIVVGTATGATHVKAFSGLDGSLLQSFLAFPGFSGGVKVAAGDLNGDDRADIAVVAGRGGNGHVKTFDGATGTLVGSFLGYDGFTGEINLAVGDVTGDGVAEVVAAARNSQSGAHVKAFTAPAAVVKSFFAPTPIGATVGAPRPEGAAVVAHQAPRISVGDLTGDRIADILLADPPGTATSLLLTLDGRTGGILQNEAAFDALFNFGVFVDL